MRTIGLDFDDTLVPMRHAVSQEMNRLYGTDLNSDTCPEFHVSRNWNYSDETFMAWFAKYESILHEYAPYEELKETLNEWAKVARLVVITARPACQIASAKDWITRHQLPIAEVISAPGNPTKAEAARAHGVELFVEDHPKHATRLADAGIKVLLLSKAYNTDCSHERIVRVTDWKEIRALKPLGFSPGVCASKETGA